MLGGALGVWDDVEAALQVGEFDGVVGCNDATVSWPGYMEGAASYHADKWPLWLERRRRKGLGPPGRVFAHLTADAATDPRFQHVEFVDAHFRGQTETGSSGLFAVKVALTELGFDKAVICGMPMDPRPHFNDAAAWDAYREHRAGWEQALPHLRARVRSMSGWTAQLLGEPTADWLA